MDRVNGTNLGREFYCNALEMTSCCEASTIMKIIAWFGFPVFLAVTALAGGLTADKFSSEMQRTTKAKRDKISLESKGLRNHPWAGEYYAGDGLGVNTTLAIAPQSGFVFEWHGCLGLYDRNHGLVSGTNDRLHLSFALENKREGFQGLAFEFIPVAWGQRTYLVPADEIIEFCNQVNDGREPRDDSHGLYLLRRGDEKRAATGSPKVPKEFQPYLLAEPIEAEIVSVGPSKTRPSAVEWRFKDTPVIINAGTSKGVRPGMKFSVTQPASRVESVKITKVGAMRSDGVITQAGEEQPGPKVGWRLSTLAPWRQVKNK